MIARKSPACERGRCIANAGGGGECPVNIPWDTHGPRLPTSPQSVGFPFETLEVVAAHGLAMQKNKDSLFFLGALHPETLKACAPATWTDGDKERSSDTLSFLFFSLSLSLSKDNYHFSGSLASFCVYIGYLKTVLQQASLLYFFVRDMSTGVCVYVCVRACV